jgi:glycerol-3-phosphate dehydrogenase
MPIKRQPDLFSQRDYDVIIVGGGIYGASLALESVFCGLKPLLLEKSDFGAATSFNSLRIVHGGLRYLQTLDLPRHFESVRERRWFLRHFPEHVQPLPCLMPLYNAGIKRKSIFRAALLINDVLSMRRNAGVAPERVLASGSIMGRSDVVSAFPGVEQEGLKGAAVWFDAAVPDSQRVLMEMLRWAAHWGADVANYVRVTSVSTSSGIVDGVMAHDDVADNEVSFRAPVVINAAGPWSSALAGQFDGQSHDWFCPSLAWNILTDKAAPGEYALALTPPRSGAPTYFLHPWKGRMFIGTGHSPWDGSVENPQPSHKQLRIMLDDLNSAAPGLALDEKNIARVFAGLLPAAGPDSAKLSKRPVFVRHSDSGGPKGLYSICGVKFTTARLVAERTLAAVPGARGRRDAAAFPRPPAASDWSSRGSDFTIGQNKEAYLDGLGRIIEDESAVKLQDIVFRRTDLWESPELAMKLAPDLARQFGWNEHKAGNELASLASELAHTAPAETAVGY